MRKFEKISYEQFVKDFGENKDLYERIVLPKRSTKTSAGYDIRSLEDYILHPGESHCFKTGLKIMMNSDEGLFLIIRSSIGYKYDVCLSNNVGLIDSDYYNNHDNEGHFSVKLINHGQNDFEVKEGDRIVQGIIMKYLTVDDEKKINSKRKGGIGSTNKKEGK